MCRFRRAKSVTSTSCKASTSAALSDEMFFTSSDKLSPRLVTAAILSASEPKALVQSDGSCVVVCARADTPTKTKITDIMIARRRENRGRSRIGLCQLHKTLSYKHSTPQKYPLRCNALDRKPGVAAMDNVFFTSPLPADRARQKPTSAH